jgi:tripartite-type tricarboxylate transporter receptor subunit TctC
LGILSGGPRPYRKNARRGRATYKETIARFDQEEFYLNSADYHAFAMKQIAEQKRFVEELGLARQ